MGWGARGSKMRMWAGLLAVGVVAGALIAAGVGVGGAPEGARAAMRTGPVTLVGDPEVLRALEAAGMGLGARLGAGGAVTTAALAKAPLARDVLRRVTADLAEVAAADPKSGVGLRYGHRLFDARWLASDEARFELAGVAARLDRQPFAPERCGEVRLIYRLGYATEVGGLRVASRLPMTVNVVYWLDGTVTGVAGCRDEAARWVRLEGLSGAALAEALVGGDGPLAGERVGLDRLRSVEVNLQSVRWPSTVHPGMAGHAEYLMRVFHLKEGRLVPGRLENTPDVARIRGSRKLQAELRTWVAANLTAIDAGTALLPEHLLAERVVSVAPRGLARLANRPFRQVLDPRTLGDLPLAGTRTIASPEALVRRLDGLSCVGCHQSRSVAGFHLLGDEPDGARRVDALALGRSPHLTEDLPRRAAWVTALAAGALPDPSRPHAERTSPGGGYGARCGLGDPGFAGWTCDAGLACAPLDEAHVGLCLPTRPSVGDPCEVGQVTQQADPHRDRVRDVAARACGPEAVCNDNRVGFPNGVCVEGCDGDDPAAACTGIPVLVGFNQCLAQKIPFEQCLADNTRPGALRACSAARPCRDDYICARTPSAPAGQGACMPPYFLFQLRVDGHAL